MNKCLAFFSVALMTASLFLSASGLGIFCQPCAAAESKLTPADFARARQLKQKQRTGESLTPDEQTFLKRAEQEFKRSKTQSKTTNKSKQGGPDKGPVPPAQSSTGLVPLTDLGKAQYQGEDGGLYGDGNNDPPAAHRAAVEQQLKEVVPRDAQGKPAVDGKIAFLSIGMSNTTMEYQVFKGKADADPRKSPNVVIVDGAQGGHDGLMWAHDGDGNSKKDPWPVLDQRLKKAGVSPQQVQVVWLKHALISPSRFGEFPKHAQVLADSTVLTLQKLHERFPNLRVAYLSSRIYAGYATTGLNPEPYAYEGGFAVRQVIQKQIEGDPQLNFDPAKGTVKSPAVLWGPYLWADGIKPRQLDQLVWLKDDLRSNDRTHPSDAGREKVAKLLLDFLHNNPLASCWYLKQ